VPADVKTEKISRFSKWLIRYNNWRRLRKQYHIRAENILLLIPSCLQYSKCPHRVTADLSNCRRCGRCKIKDIIEMAEELGVQACVATGGRLALQRTQDPSIEAIIAVACEKELKEGLIACKKPVLAVTNLRPHGPCKDTDVDLSQVRQAVRHFMGAEAAS